MGIIELEKKICELITSGKTTKEVSKILKISEHCAKSVVIRLLTKAGIRDVYSYALYCYNKNLATKKDIVQNK